MYKIKLVKIQQLIGAQIDKKALMYILRDLGRYNEKQLKCFQEDKEYNR